jgi:hypothetical protein
MKPVPDETELVQLSKAGRDGVKYDRYDVSNTQLRRKTHDDITNVITFTRNRGAHA